MSNYYNNFLTSTAMEKGEQALFENFCGKIIKGADYKKDLSTDELESLYGLFTGIMETMNAKVGKMDPKEMIELVEHLENIERELKMN